MIDSPHFLTVEEVEAIHRSQIAETGGDTGLRDRGGLLSALAQPEATFAGAWLHDSLWLMAAAYTFHLARNHPFVDGNKRVGTASALVFLALNGWRVEADEDALADLVLAVVAGTVDKARFAAFLQAHAVPWDASP